MNNETQPARKSLRIIILEDEQALSALFEMCLLEWYGDVDIVAFSRGDDALRELKRLGPDLFVLDWAHPGMSGQAILEELVMDQAKYPILLTSEFFADHLQMFTKLGLKLGFLPKPFGIEEFSNVLSQLLGPGGHARTSRHPKGR